MADYDAHPGRKPPGQPGLAAAQREADEAGLHAGLRRLAGMVPGARGVIWVLGEVAEFATHAIPGADGVGVTLINPSEGRPSIQATAATAAHIHKIDAVQYDELSEGPCITSIQLRRATVTGSLGSDQRWPDFGGRVAQMGVQSALSLPLMVAEHVIGAISAYADSSDAFGVDAVRLGSRFAEAAAVSIYNAQLLGEARAHTEQLQHALDTRIGQFIRTSDSRAIIDQAIGVIRSRSGASAEWALGRLVRMSQTENTELHVIAERVVEQAVRRAKTRRRQR
jgi:GAF domain-containing protein